MPIHEYQCTWCGKIFIAALPLETRQERNVACPNCGDRRIELLISSFSPETDRES